MGDGNDVATAKDHPLSTFLEPVGEMRSPSGRNSAVPANRNPAIEPLPANRAADPRTGSGRFGKENGLVAGVDIGGSNLRVALADLQGNVLGRWKSSTEATSSPEM